MRFPSRMAAQYAGDSPVAVASVRGWLAGLANPLAELSRDRGRPAPGDGRPATAPDPHFDSSDAIRSRGRKHPCSQLSALAAHRAVVLWQLLPYLKKVISQRGFTVKVGQSKSPFDKPPISSRSR